MPELSHPISASTTIEGPLDGSHVLPILPDPIQGQIGITLPGLEGVIRRWCDPQAGLAVELRRREICAGLLLYLTGLAQFTDLAHKFLDPVSLRARQAALLIGITAGLLTPDAQAAARTSQAAAQSPCRWSCRWRDRRRSLGNAEHRASEAQPDSLHDHHQRHADRVSVTTSPRNRQQATRFCRPRKLRTHGDLTSRCRSWDAHGPEFRYCRNRKAHSA